MTGEVRAAARACRLVDDRGQGYRELLKELYPHTLRAFWIGITGSPGAGKSTLGARLVQHFRSQGRRVGVVAIDPSSPFSGGAILGDRIRMQEHFEDPEVFIRSVATRGAQGGLSRSAVDIARVLSAWGADVVLLETVGVGQDELEVAFAAHTTLVVMAPGMGDGVQAIKAGLLEVADVFAVNKADLPGAASTAADLEQMLSLGQEPAMASAGHHGYSHAMPMGQESATEDAWRGTEKQSFRPPVVTCVASLGVGIQEVVAALEMHRIWQQTSPEGQLARLARGRQALLNTLRDEAARVVLERHTVELEELVGLIEAGRLDPYSACERLLAAAAALLLR